MSVRVLITGGAGFVGSNLVRACLQEDWQVAVIYQPENGLAQIQDVLSQVTLFPVLGKKGEVSRILGDYQPQLVIHLASVYVSKHTPEDVSTLIDANIGFGSQLLEAMVEHGVHYLVNTGTSWQHFENCDYNPVNLYAATKQAFEDILRYYVEIHAIQAITLKLFDTYGPADPRPKLLSLLEQAARAQAEIDMSPGNQLIDLVYIEDVVEAFLCAAKRLLDHKVEHHESYAVSSGKPLPLRDLVNLYKELSGNAFVPHWGGLPYREREVMIPWNTGKALPGWSPKITLEQGLRNCLSVPAQDQHEPLVTVCIPVYNCQDYIAEAIESVLAQTLNDFELLIVDNASTDRTMEVVAQYTDSRIRIIRNQKNIGFEANWNKVISEARGIYVKLLPADDFLYPNCLKTQVAIFQRPEHASLAIVSCARNIIDPHGRKLIVRKFPGTARQIYGRNAIRAVLRSGTNLLGEPGAILFKRSLLENVGLFDGSLLYVIDVHLWLRMLLQGDLFVIPDVHCAFRLSSGSSSLEYATLQSKHFTRFIRNLSADQRYGVRWIDRTAGTVTSQLLGFARRMFYILTINRGTSHG